MSHTSSASLNSTLCGTGTGTSSAPPRPDTRLDDTPSPGPLYSEGSQSNLHTLRPSRSAEGSLNSTQPGNRLLAASRSRDDYDDEEDGEGDDRIQSVVLPPGSDSSAHTPLVFVTTTVSMGSVPALPTPLVAAVESSLAAPLFGVGASSPSPITEETAVLQQQAVEEESVPPDTTGPAASPKDADDEAAVPPVVSVSGSASYAPLSADAGGSQNEPAAVTYYQVPHGNDASDDSSSDSDSDSVGGNDLGEKEQLPRRHHSGRSHLLGPFTPLVQQADYRKTDIKHIACTSPYTCMQLVSSTEVSLKIPKAKSLTNLNPVEKIADALRKGGVARSVHKNKRTRLVSTGDFPPSPVGYDSIILAISLSLWGSVLYAHDLVTAARHYFRAALSEEEKRDPRTRVRVTLSALLSWLNREGIDVLIMTSDREASSSFCAKRASVRRMRQRLEETQCTENGAQQHSSSSSRVLVALEYDGAHRVWGPLVTNRPIRAIARKMRLMEREGKREVRQRARRAERQAVREATAEASAKRIAEKFLEWEERKRQLEQSTTASSTNEDVVHTAVEVYKAPQFDSIDKEEPLSSTSDLPFDKMEYPNIVQTDFGIGPLLREGTHPALPSMRWKFLLGSGLGALSICFSIALVVFMADTYRHCVYSEQLGRCLTDADIPTAQPQRCYLTMRDAQYKSSLIHRFLFGQTMGAGNSLLVCISLQAAALICGVLSIVLAARFLATRSKKPGFLYLLQGVHVLLGTLATALAAYVLSITSKPTYEFRCELFKLLDKTTCTYKVEGCPDLDYQVSQSPSPPHTALALNIVLVVMCVLELIVSIVPLLPSMRVRRQLPAAQPQTNAFRPSEFIPDGITPAQVEHLQEIMQPHLRVLLQKHVHAQEKLLKRHLTVGEMMQAHREMSINQMKLNKEKERENMRKRGEYRPNRGVLRYMRDLTTGEPQATGLDADFVLGTNLTVAVRSISKEAKARIARGEMPLADDPSASVSVFASHRASSVGAAAAQSVSMHPSSSMDVGSVASPLSAGSRAAFPRTKSSHQLLSGSFRKRPQNMSFRSGGAAKSLTHAASSTGDNSSDVHSTSFYGKRWSKSTRDRGDVRSGESSGREARPSTTSLQSATRSAPVPPRAQDRILKEKEADILKIVQRMREGGNSNEKTSASDADV